VIAATNERAKILTWDISELRFALNAIRESVAVPVWFRIKGAPAIQLIYSAEGAPRANRRAVPT
jgi:hypothetical protein